MKKLISYSQDYIQEMKIWEVGLLKIGMCAIGVILGLSLPKHKKKPAIAGAGLIALGTLIPVVVNWFRSMLQSYHYEQDLELF